jgi:tetratricopeptide (TPR) repeat protein
MEASNDPKDQQRVTTIYRLIAKELKQQFEALETVEEKKKFAGSLASFLGSIEQDSDDSKTVLWAGSTLLSVAESLSQLSLTANAKPLFQQAVSALNRAESLGFAGDPQEVAMTMELNRQRALAQRGAGNFEAAVDQFTEILKQNSNSLQIQIDAAKTLQGWGKARKRAKLYGEAMMGTGKFTNPKTNRDSNLIWGWRKMVQATRSNPKFRETYFEALYRLIECRLEYGLLEKSEKAIKSSMTELTNAEKRHPDLGGPAQKQKFMELKKRIQQAQN